MKDRTVKRCDATDPCGLAGCAPAGRPRRVQQEDRSMAASAPTDTHAQFLHCAMACRRIQKRICKMPERAWILVVFGIGCEGKDRASCFAQRDAEPALTVATLAGLRVPWIEDE